MNDFEGKSVIELSASVIDSFPGHPYAVTDDADMEALKKSISERGVINPVIVRKKSDGRYEMISGHRRKYACESLGLGNLPCIVVEVDNDTATLMMVDANKNRSKLRPSEKAKAYDMQYRALKHQGKRLCDDSGDDLRSDEILARMIGGSRSQIHRYRKLLKLIPGILALVDDGVLGIRPAGALSELSEEMQEYVLNCYEQYGVVPTEMQVNEISNLPLDSWDREDSVSYNDVVDILVNQSVKISGRISFEVKDLLEYFPEAESKEEIKESIMDLLLTEKYQNRFA